MNDLAGAAALLARSHRLHRAERGALRGLDCAAAFTVGAYLRRSPGRAARTLAVGALLDARNGDFLLAAESRFLKAHGHGGLYAFAAPRRVRIAACTSAEAEAAEHVAEYIAQITEAAKTAEARAATAATAAETGVRVKGRMTELIVFLALLGIGQHFVCLVALLEALLTGFVAGVQIRVVLLGELPVCFFYVIG